MPPPPAPSRPSSSSTEAPQTARPATVSPVRARGAVPACSQMISAEDYRVAIMYSALRPLFCDYFAPGPLQQRQCLARNAFTRIVVCTAFEVPRGRGKIAALPLGTASGFGAPEVRDCAVRAHKSVATASTSGDDSDG